MENFALCELIRQQGWSQTEFHLSHFRDTHGSEVGLVVETPRGVIGVEVKPAAAATAAHFKHLARLRERLGDEFLCGIVLTTGLANVLATDCCPCPCPACGAPGERMPLSVRCLHV